MRWSVVAGVLLGLVVLATACNRAQRVRFVEACPVYAEPTRGSTKVGSIVAGSPYEVRRREGKWIQLRVKSNSSIGWTECPLQQ